MRGAGLFAVLQNGNDAWRELRGSRSPLALRPLRGPADIVWIGSEALSDGHHSVDVNGKTFGAGRARRTRRD